MVAYAQPELLPRLPLKPVLGHVRLDQLPHDLDLIGPEPSRDLIEDIKVNGVLDPIKLTEVGGRWIVVAGRRRVKAARLAGLEEVPATYLSGGEVDTPSLVARDHALRHENVAAELEAVEALVNRGYDESRIAVATGYPVQTIRKRLRLLGLHDDFRAALDHGALSSHLAESIARLPAAAQERLATMVSGDDGPPLTEALVREQRLAVSQAAIVIPTPLPGMPTGREPGDDSTARALSDFLSDRFDSVLRLDPTSFRVARGDKTYVVKIVAEQ